MKKTVYFLGIVFFIFTIFYINLGRWLDVTEDPVKADIVVCLGGGTIERVKKSVDLITQGYVKSKTLLLIGESWYNRPYIRKHYPTLQWEIDDTPKNTAQEVVQIKKYMRKHGYRTALIVTDPPHTRRVRVLLSLLERKEDDPLYFYLVGSGVNWWNKTAYYTNSWACQEVWHELKGIGYALLVYGLFEENDRI